MNGRRTLRHLAIVTIALWTAAGALAQVATNWRDIKTPPLHKFEIPKPKRIVFPNGMIVFLQEDHELPLIRGSVLIRGGSTDEPADKVGLVDIYGSVWRTGGTTSKTGDQLDDYLESRAAKIETSGDDDSTSLSWDSLKGDFNDVFAVAVDLLEHPAFREDKLPIAKNQLNTAIARRNDNIQGIASREATKLVYGADSPYARVPEYATVAAVTRDDLVTWHERTVHPNDMIVGVVGDFDSKTMEATLRKAFGSWKRGPETKAPEIPLHPAKPGVYFVEKDDVTQSQIRMVEPGIRKDNPDYFAVQVMNEIFGGGFSSRLFSHVRSEKGLAYSVGGGIGSDYDHPGAFSISMGTKSGTTLAGIHALYHEIDLLQSTPVTAAELKRAKESILNSFIFRVDSKRKVLGEEMSLEFYGYPLDFLEQFRKAVEKVTIPEVDAVAKKYIHKDTLALLVVGKKADFDGDLASLGPVKTIDITIPTPGGKKKAVAGNAEGKALLAKVVDGLGGAKRVAGVSSIRREASMNVKTPQGGTMQIGIITVEAWPDSMMQTAKTPMGEVKTVATPDAAFMVMAGQTRDLPASRRDDMLKSVKKSALFVARSANDPKLVVSAAGTEKIGNVDAKILDVEIDGARVRWYVDPSNGRILRSVSTEMGMTGPAERVSNYSDYREVDGLWQPFKIEITSGGKPAGDVMITKMEVNPKIDPAAFKKPE